MERMISSSLLALFFGGCLNAGCSVSGHVPTVGESLRLPDPAHAPAVECHKSWMSVWCKVSADASAKIQKLSVNKETGAFELEGLDTSTIPSQTLKQYGENAVALKDLYSLNVEGKLKEINIKEESKRQIAVAGFQTGQNIAGMILPMFGASAEALSAARPGLNAGLRAGGVIPGQLIQELFAGLSGPEQAALSQVLKLQVLQPGSQPPVTP